MGKNNDGRLTSEERRELQALVREAEEIALANARMLADQRDRLSRSSSGMVGSASAVGGCTRLHGELWLGGSSYGRYT